MNTKHHAALLLLLWTAFLTPHSSAAAASGAANAPAGACALTARNALSACQHDVSASYWIATGNCTNLKDSAARTQCVEETADIRDEERQLCREQLEARLDACGELGESRYDPRIDPPLFVDPRQIGKSVAPNPYMPLIPGRTMIYRNGSERIETTVTKQTVKILGVRCAVIHDVARDGDELIEDTIDWLAQDIYGNVWYFGEISQQFENGELKSLDGSWKAGVDFAKPGITMKAAPAAGDVYRQEFALGTAEDMGKVLSLTASARTPAGACNKDCLLTKDFTPLEPETVEHKYYAPNVGLLLDLDTVTGERERLVEIRE